MPERNVLQSLHSCHNYTSEIPPALGIIIDNKLTFEYQVKSVLKKMALGKKAIQTIRNNLPKKCLKVLLHALVLSHFEYCNLLLTVTSHLA